ncbi:DUF3558 family protein [Amycolatopsis sp. YIM 10]|uniref:DUF3558 family protein n=1 Tax=Amycolatopsis sp. YIM 10 TaxID=2653857 RepID=UPI00128FD5FB|nr:DUF3558 family protein [Amycolatopsis sp. YIM 10]
MIRKSYVLVGITLLATLSACSEKSNGQALPTSDSGTSAVPSSGSNPPVDGADVFGGIKACEVLDKALEGKGFKPGYVQNAGSHNGCASEKTSFAVALDLDDKQGLGDLRSDPARTYDARLNGRSAKQVKGRDEEDGGTCEIFFEVAEKARTGVTVVLGTGGSTDEACQEAGKLAEAVEPLLPKA